MAEILFYLLSVATIGFAIGVVSAKSPMHSVLSLLGSFLGLAVIYLLCGFQFLAAAQILVYAGAIMVLFLFVIMLLNLGDPATFARAAFATLSRPRIAWSAVVACALALAGIGAAAMVEVRDLSGGIYPGGFDNLQGLAALLFSRYLLPFEAASLLLLMTMVGVLLLAKRQRAGLALHEGHEGLGLGDAPAVEPEASKGAAQS